MFLIVIAGDPEITPQFVDFTSTAVVMLISCLVLV